MVRTKSAISAVIERQGRETDGRKERSRASRTKILLALMELIAAGDINPSAAKIAERAGVGLRSVFRHYEDKDSLYLEMHQIHVDAYGPEFREPYQSSDWHEQVIELIRRWARVNEAIAPFRISLSVGRYNSKVLAKNYRELLKIERSLLDEILPEEINKDKRVRQSIALLAGFDTWRFFRQDEELSPRKTVETIEALVRDLFARL